MNEVFGFKTRVKPVVVMMLRQGGLFYRHCLFVRSIFGDWEGAVAGKDGETYRGIFLGLRIQKKNG